MLYPLGQEMQASETTPLAVVEWNRKGLYTMQREKLIKARLSKGSSVTCNM